MRTIEYTTQFKRDYKREINREVKQTGGIERCQARTGRAQRNHIFLAMAAWFEQHKLRITQKITLYQQNWDVIKNAIQQQIKILMLQAA